MQDKDMHCLSKYMQKQTENQKNIKGVYFYYDPQWEKYTFNSDHILHHQIKWNGPIHQKSWKISHFEELN